MSSPFHIDEIFPDSAGPALPRLRQLGGPAQDFAVTLMADYTLKNRAWLPSARSSRYWASSR